MHGNIPSPFYRVTVKALVRDDQGRILAVENDKGWWEMPGGGWEHDEELTSCLARELYEELGVGVVKVGAILFAYRGVSSAGYRTLRLVVPVLLNSHSFKMGDHMRRAKFLDRDEFLRTNFAQSEAPIREYAGVLWPGVE